MENRITTHKDTLKAFYLSKSFENTAKHYSKQEQHFKAGAYYGYALRAFELYRTLREKHNDDYLPL